MISLSSSSERIARIPLQSTLIQCKITRCQEQMEQASFRDKQILKKAIEVLQKIKAHPDFLSNPRGYLKECISQPQNDPIALQKMTEVFDELGDVYRSCQL